MSQINFKLRVSINEAKDLIKTVGHEITPIIVSEPGVGKSSILKMLEAEMGTDEYDFIYVDCPVKDMMDIAASIPNHESRSLEYYVSSLFKLGNGKKKVIMLDEFMKAPKLLQVIFTRMMLERTVGDVPLPEGSILFGTSNNASDGVGDNMLAHAANRVCLADMRKPSADEWNAWAGGVVDGKPRVARSIRAWVAMNPRVMKSYTDPDQSDNPYIFKPSGSAKSFASPRSLTKASVIVENRNKFSENTLAVALAGTIGEAAAKSMAAFINLESKLVPYAEIIKSPDTAKVPSDISALIMMMFEATDYIEDQGGLTSYMEFVKRIPHSEVQSLFFTMMMRTKPRIARYNEQIKNWAIENHMLM